jgi:hypothetical protein
MTSTSPRRHAWFGRHSVAASYQSDKNFFGNGVIAEYNLAPNNSQPIDSATNIILRRTYLDFSTPGGAHGALDPWKNPIPESPWHEGRLRLEQRVPMDHHGEQKRHGRTAEPFPG